MYTGPAEVGVPGVQWHTQYFAPAFTEDHVLSQKIGIYLQMDPPNIEWLPPALVPF